MSLRPFFYDSVQLESKIICQQNLFSNSSRPPPTHIRIYERISWVTNSRLKFADILRLQEGGIGSTVPEKREGQWERQKKAQVGEVLYHVVGCRDSYLSFGVSYSRCGCVAPWYGVHDTRAMLACTVCTRTTNTRPFIILRQTLLQNDSTAVLHE